MAGIYIHIPFCKQACHYCDFHFSTNLNNKDTLVQMISKELVLQKDYLKDAPISTIYFGGGTPSLLEARELELILDTIHRHYAVSLEEVTIETNPDDLNEQKIQELKLLGFDRLSIGVQSFNDEVLKFYNRAHNSRESISSIEKARAYGFTKMSIDLMYGFPSEDHTIWKSDLAQAILLDPGHISSYCLSIEEDTALGRWTKKGTFAPAMEDFAAEQFELLQSELGQAGYIQYEISNFGKEDDFAVHNTNYWRGTPYLGVGPSAHSFDGKSRQSNISNNGKYIRSLREAQVPYTLETLSAQDLTNEYILTSLRTVWGADLQVLQNRHNIDLAGEKRLEIDQFINQKMMVKQGDFLILSPQGKLLADYIAEKLFV